MTELDLIFRSAASCSRCGRSTFDPKIKICSGVFSSLGNTKSQIPSSLGKPREHLWNFKTWTLPPVRHRWGLWAAVHAPCHRRLDVRLPGILPGCSSLQNLFLLGTWGGYGVPAYWLKPPAAPAPTRGRFPPTGNEESPESFHVCVSHSYHLMTS